MLDPVDQFKAALARRGIVPKDGEIVADGHIQRCDASGRGGKGDASYLLHLDGVPAGGFENWRDGLGWEKWRADIDRTLSPAEEAAHLVRLEKSRRERELEDAKRKAEARERAVSVFEEAAHCDSHPYTVRKGIQTHGARLWRDRLVLPMRDVDGTLHSLQFIGPDGEKRYLPRGRVAGCYFVIGRPDKVLCVAEGFATGASIHEATGYAVAVAFDAGNLAAVTRALHKRDPDLLFIVCADDDYLTEGNPGISKATEAALSVGALLAVPDFGIHRPERATDFNDMALACGKEAVKRAIAGASAPEAGKAQFDNKSPPTGHAESNGWPEPHSLAAKVKPEPYPLDALPLSIRLAVEEVAGFVKAPVVMVASSALAALSLAIQAHVDVKRAEKLHGPVGLFLLTIADSGERKSTCDGFFTRAIRDYQEAQAEAAVPALQEHRANLGAWEAKCAGIKEKIRHLAKDDKPTAELEAALRDLERNKPEPRKVPRLLYADATPEALAFGLAKQWPSGGVVSAEAGVAVSESTHGLVREPAGLVSRRRPVSLVSNVDIRHWQ